MRSFVLICIASFCLSISATNTPRNNFEIILQTDPSLCEIPQKVYLHTLVEEEHYLLDSAIIDNKHKTVRLSGYIPYQKNVILAFSRTHLDAEVAVTPGEKIQISFSESDAEYFHCIKDAKAEMSFSLHHEETVTISYQDLSSISIILTNSHFLSTLIMNH